MAATRRNGQAFILTTVATIVLLILGLGIASWFATSENSLGFELTSSIRLASVELCANNRCSTTLAFVTAGDSYSNLGFATLVVGVAFGAVLAWSLHRRIATTEIPRALRLAGYTLGACAFAMSLGCMFVVPPHHIGFDFGSDRFELTADDDLGLTGKPHLALGGFFTLAGLVLGTILLHGGRPATSDDDEPQRDDNRREARFRREFVPPPRGVETDPFRAPPAPPPLAVIRNDRPTTAPVVLDPDDERPKLLR